MTTDEMLPIARTMDEAGFHVIDLTGGAAIDISVMYLGENPFERVRRMAALIRRTPLNFNTRGQSIFRWMQYADDVAEFEVGGIATTLALHRELLATREFATHAYDTRWVGDRLTRIAAEETTA